MHKKLFSFFYLIYFCLTIPIYAEANTNQKFTCPKGEYLEYQVYFSFIHAGTAIMQVDKDVHDIDGHSCYRLQVQGTSNSALKFLGMSIANIWESYLDVALLQPRRFLAHMKENNYEREERIDFDYQEGKARTEIAESTHNMQPQVSYCPITATIKDLVSGYYFLRNIDSKTLKKNDKLVLNILHDNKVYSDATIVFLGKRLITKKLGQINSLVFAPVIPSEDGVFTGDQPIKIFISDDVNKIPIKIDINHMLGTISIELSKYSGLKKEILFKNS